MIGAHRPGDPADGSARMRILKKLFWYALALAFLVEAWLWDTSVAALHAIVDRLPLVRFKAACARGIERLPPLAVLPIFLLPVIVLLPFKLAALWLLAQGALVAGGLAFIGAKIVSVGLAAFIFDLTRDKLLSMPWFARLYARVMSWRDRAHAIVDPYKAQVKAAARELRAAVWARLGVAARGDGAFARKIALLRDRARRKSSG
jgi:hypothetical protein